MIALDYPLCSKCLRQKRVELGEYRYDAGEYGITYFCFTHAASVRWQDKYRLHYLKGEQEPMPTFDASQVPGATQDMKEAKSLNDLMGEPLQINFIRALNIPPKNGQPQRTSYVGEYLSLATGESGEVWLPDRQGAVLLKFQQEHEDASFQGRWFKDPEIDGEIKRGWQFLGVDQVPEDKGNKAVLLMSGKVGEAVPATSTSTMPF